MRANQMPSQVRVIGLCCGALCIPLLIPLTSGRVFTSDDLLTYHLPLRYLYSQAIRGGDSILWSPALSSGVYLFGEGQVGMAHPFHLLLYRLLPLGQAFNLEIITSYIAALAGAVLLLRRLGLSNEGACFGAMVFAFSGFNLLHLVHPNAIGIISHAPWFLLAAHVLLTSPNQASRAVAFASTALLLASQLLLGYPQYVWMTSLAVGYLALCLLVAGAALSRLAMLCVAAVLGVLIGCVQLLPTLDAWSGSVRAAPSLDFRMSYSLPPLDLVQLWSPYAFEHRIYSSPVESQVHELSVYNGAFCTVALAWLVARYSAFRQRGLGLALLVLATVGLVLALGRYGGIYFWLAQLPGLSMFRAPARHIALFHLALSGIAALVFEDVVGMVHDGQFIEVRRLWPLALPVVLTLTTLGIVVAGVPPSWDAVVGVRLARPMQAGAGSLLVVLTALLFALAGRGRRWPVSALVVVAALDQGLWGYLYVYERGPLRTVSQIAATAPVPPEAKRGDLIEPGKTWSPTNLGVLRGLRVSSAYLALVPSSFLDLDEPVAQRLAGISWREGTAGWMRVPDSMPRARLLAKAEHSDDIRADVRGTDISRVALVDRPIEPLAGTPGQTRIIADRPGRIVVETAASGPQLLVVTERFHEGWRASEGNRECRVTRVYGDFIGCVVAPGTRRVTFTFAPASVRNGIRLTLMGLLLTLVATVVIWQC